MKSTNNHCLKHFGKVFYKFARYLRHEFDDHDIMSEIDTVVADQFPLFLDYLVGT